MSVRRNHALKFPEKSFPDCPVVQPDLIIPENMLYQNEFLASAARNMPHIEGNVKHTKSVRQFSGPD